MSYLNSPRKGQDNLCGDSSRPNKWKTTSKRKMEEDLKQKHGRRPKKNGRRPQKNGRQHQKKMEDDLKK